MNYISVYEAAINDIKKLCTNVLNYEYANELDKQVIYKLIQILKRHRLLNPGEI